MKVNSSSAKLIILPHGGLIAGNRIAVHPRLVSSSSVGLLTGEMNRPQQAVRILPIDQMPEKAVAVGEDLAVKLGLQDSDRAVWQLQVGELASKPAQEVCLEVTLENQLDQVVDELNRSDDLAGQLIWVAPGGSCEAVSLEVSGKPYRVRELSPAPDTAGTVYEITPNTRLRVFSPGIKSGVDVVILADCSGSMGLADLTDTSDAIPSRASGRSSSKNISRMEALHRALNQLLDTRLRVSGRVSRMALVGFTRTCIVRFPRGADGMVEMDANSTPQVKQDFRDAIGLLRKEKAGTDIGQALHFAAELLHQHGHAGNDRLVVLISDGASWQAKGDDATGEEVGGLEDEVSLMERLHDMMDIHLHAIGISKPELFRPWFKRNYPEEEAHVSWIPNHELLERLVAVGGGDPSRTGDTEVVGAYFSGLGNGVTRQVQSPRHAAVPSLQRDEAAALEAARQRFAQVAATPEQRAEREKLAANILDLYESCNNFAETLTGEMLFPDRKTISLLYRLDKEEVSDPDSFQLFITNLNVAIFDNIHQNLMRDAVEGSQKKGQRSGTYPLPAAVAIYNSAKAKDIRLLRHYYAHGKVAASELVRIGNILTRLINVSAVERNDAARWCQLQLAILHDLRSTLEEFVKAFREAPAQPQPPAPKTSRSTGFVFME